MATSFQVCTAKAVRFLFCCDDCISSVQYVLRLSNDKQRIPWDELTVTLGAISLLLLASMSASPVAIDRALGHLTREALTEVVEDSEFVFAEQVRVRVGFQVVCDLSDGVFEECSDTRVEVAFGVAGDIDGPLVGQLANTVNADRVSVGGATAHCRGGDGDGVAKV